MLRNKHKKCKGSTLNSNLIYDKDTISKMWPEGGALAMFRAVKLLPMIL